MANKADQKSEYDELRDHVNAIDLGDYKELRELLNAFVDIMDPKAK